jgi:hypothetical protein
MFGLPYREHRSSGQLCLTDAKPGQRKVNASVNADSADNALVNAVNAP